MEHHKFKRFFITVMLFLLFRALRACQQLDSRVRQELQSLPEGIAILLGLEDYEGGVAFVREGDSLRRIWSIPENHQAGKLEIRFKTLGAAIRLVCGKESVPQSYARNNIILAGELRWGMTLVRCIERVENYIFPAFISRRIFSTPLNKEVTTRRVYTKMIFMK